MLRFLTIAALVTLAACSDSSTAPSSPHQPVAAGVWTLRSRDGRPMPVALTGRQAGLTITSDVLTITGSTSGTYTKLRTYSYFDAAPMTLTESEGGTWSSSAPGSIRFAPTLVNTLPYFGVVTDTTLTTTTATETFTLVYGR